jgi:hypothetical protein
MASILLVKDGPGVGRQLTSLLVFACPLGLPLRGRSYRGIHLLRAYRAHPDYGRLPVVLVAVAGPQGLEGRGSTELVDTFADPTAVLAAVDRLLQPPGPPTSSLVPGHPDADVGQRPGGSAIASRAHQAVGAVAPGPKGVGMPSALEPSAHRGG